MTGRIMIKLCAGSIALCLSACVAHYTRDQQTAVGFEYESPTVVLASLNYTPTGPVVLEPRIKELRHHDAIPLFYPSNGSNGHALNRVEGLYLRSRLPGPKKLVIVLPIWGTSTYPPRKISNGYANHSEGDAHVIWIYGEPPLFPWETLSSTPSEEEWVTIAEDGIERYRTAVVDTRRLLDWVTTREEIDPKRIAIIGFSMGALAAATIMGNDARVSTGVYMMGGADFANVLTECRGKAGRIREHAMETYGWSLEYFRQFFETRIGNADPRNYAGHYNPDKILMIDARYDNCIPASSREALWEVTGYPERVTMLYRHKGSFYSLTPLGFNFARGMIYDFLDETL